jgi:hypothetical protein
MLICATFNLREIWNAPPCCYPSNSSMHVFICIWQTQVLLDELCDLKRKVISPQQCYSDSLFPYWNPIYAWASGPHFLQEQMLQDANRVLKRKVSDSWTGKLVARTVGTGSSSPYKQWSFSYLCICHHNFEAERLNRGCHVYMQFIAAASACNIPTLLCFFAGSFIVGPLFVSAGRIQGRGCFSPAASVARWRRHVVPWPSTARTLLPGSGEQPISATYVISLSLSYTQPHTHKVVSVSWILHYFRLCRYHTMDMNQEPVPEPGGCYPPAWMA